jgi:hypothetical protein
MKKILLLLLVIGIFRHVQAQDVGQILAGSLQDVNRYADAYLKPAGEGEIYNISRGWFNTARVHKTLGFDIAIKSEFAIIPDGSANFTFNNSDYNSFSLAGAATSATLPTIAGGNTSQVINVNTTVNGQQGHTSFNAPNGLMGNFNTNQSIIPVSVPLPIVQLSVGLFKHTELKIRYFPKTTFNKFDLSIFGVAVQHEITNYMPFARRIHFLHFSVLAGYNSMNADFKPNFDASSAVQSSNANINYKLGAFTLQGIASVKFSLLELYAAIGYSNGNSTMNVNGDYTITYNTGFPPPNSTVTTTKSNPVSLSYSAGGISNTWGIRLNLTILKVYADYTFAKYKGIGVGVALGIR